MPLAFESESHGTIAFGFFNIESDMLLLDRYFFFATDFCKAVCNMAKEPGGIRSKNSFPAYVIDSAAGIGDLHGAIAGTHYSGFIGETYKKYPFPKDVMKFKQQTDGFRTQKIFLQMILDFAESTRLVLNPVNKEKKVSFEPYAFSEQNFSQLIKYVIDGGYPRWLNDIAPDYVLKMQEEVALRRRKQ